MWHAHSLDTMPNTAGLTNSINAFNRSFLSSRAGLCVTYVDPVTDLAEFI